MDAENGRLKAALTGGFARDMVVLRSCPRFFAASSLPIVVAGIAWLRQRILPGLFGFVCVGSLAAPKPLMFFLGRQMSTNGDVSAVAEWNERWKLAPSRRVMRLITGAWGIGFLIEAIVRVKIAYALAPLTVLALSPAITYGTLGLLIAWPLAYSAYARRKYAGVMPAT